MTCWLRLSLVPMMGGAQKKPILTIIVGNKRLRKVVEEEYLAVTPRFKPPPKRQPNSFNCWIPLGWCGNLLI